MPVAVAVQKLDVADWASGPAKCGWLGIRPSQKWLPELMWLAGPLAQLNVTGWAFGPAKNGCQNKKMAAHMCAACGHFSDPASETETMFWKE